MDFENKLNAAKLSGQAPDCVYIVLSSLAPWGVRGEFLVLDDYLAKWDERSDFLESALKVGKVGGKYMALGVAPAPVNFVYRKDLFEKAGLDPAKPPKNWKELRDYAEKLTKKDAKGNIVQSGIDMPTTDFYLNIAEPFMLMNGADVIDEVNLKPMLTDPAVAETLEYMYGFAKAGLSLPNDWQKKETMAFMNGTSAMAFLQVDSVKALVKNKPELDGQVLYAPPLSNKETSAFCGYRLLAIMKGSKNPEATWEVMQAFVGMDETRRRMEQLGIVPIRKSLRDEFIKMNPAVNKGRRRDRRRRQGRFRDSVGQHALQVLVAGIRVRHAGEGQGRRRHEEGAGTDSRRSLIQHRIVLRKYGTPRRTALSLERRIR